MTDSFWKDRQVLITGAGGFIGSHLVEQLAGQGAHVRAFVRNNSRGDPGLLRLLAPDLASRVEIVAGDLRDEQAVREVVRDREFVFHLAALISIPYSYRHPSDVAETNFMGTLNVLEACREFRTGRLIHSSSSEVYGSALTVPMDERHPLRAQSPYAASKIAADKLAESFYCSYDLPVVTVRPFNTFGPRQSARAVIPTMITQVLTNGTLHLGDLDTRRDFTYVEDTVGGFLKAACTGKVEGQQFNLGTGHDIEIRELAQLVIQKAGHPVKIVVDPQRLRPDKSEVRRLLSDNGLARRALGWTPEVAFEDGLDRTFRWIEAHLDFYRPERYEF